MHGLFTLTVRAAIWDNVGRLDGGFKAFSDANDPGERPEHKWVLHPEVNAKDGVVDGAVPGLRGAGGQDNLGIREGLHEVSVGQNTVTWSNSAKKR